MNAKFSEHRFVFLWVLLNFFQPRMFEALCGCCPFICVEVEHWKQKRWEFYGVLFRPFVLLAKNIVKSPGREDNHNLESIALLLFSKKKKKTKTFGRLLAHSRFEADKFQKKLWFCCRTVFPKYTFRALALRLSGWRRANALNFRFRDTLQWPIYISTQLIEQNLRSRFSLQKFTAMYGSLI